MCIKCAFAGYGTLTADVEGFQGVELACIGDPDSHSVLLLDGWIRYRCFHPSKVQGGSDILIKIGEQAGYR
ncbi:MAG: hypothetical protein V3V57_05245, partial [Spirochaetia bacterium]